MDRPSATEFLAFEWLMFGCKVLDVGSVYSMSRRNIRRAIERTIGEPLRIRSEEEIVRGLMAMGEHCTFEDVESVLCGVRKDRWKKYLSKWVTQRTSGAHDVSQGMSPHVAIRERSHFEFVPLGRWFSGKRYGVVIDDEVSAALVNAEIDISAFDISLPWSPILVKLGDREFLMYSERGKSVFVEFFVVESDGDFHVSHSGRPAEIKTSKAALAAWVACISKGESSGDCFELKVGSCLVALLPKVNAKTLMVKHKISAEAEVDKGSWVRKGYFRSTKDGVAWVDGTVCRKELPFVHKVHELKKKGQAQGALGGP